MSKPLTIEQLKALEVGDWVWLIDKVGDTKSYWSISENTNEYLLVYQECYSFGTLAYSDYGKTWLAYKNKEQAEGKDDEIRKQTAKEILQDLYNQANNVWKAIEWTTEDIKQYATKYRVEVEE